MDFQNMLYTIQDGIAVVTFNRPKVLNALNNLTVEELSVIAADLEKNEDVKGVIITGAGEKAFVAGADINELSAMNALEGKAFARKGQKVYTALENLPKPVLAAVNGYALGGGCELAMACHIRIAAENAVFGQPEVNLGIIPGYGGTQRLPRLIGKGPALEIILSGKMISAEEALRLGLVNKVVPADQLMAEAGNLLKTILSRGPLAVRYALDAVHHGLNMSIEEAMDYEATLFGLVCATEDMKEGTKAFLEKRGANFQGK
ncbi:putative enoyl-CoA hydratase echA8 [bacterium BMS3Abin05]|nr:putative enoyl-CoA hydratase echA8 [bacterium BMS3Abin05]GBE28212.1 putative enoyl-CoA hydratase echA8 [bacterium BMS3Bbin03]HDZ11224.1 hypothetical protein [Bacteroidota bacterium]